MAAMKAAQRAMATAMIYLTPEAGNNPQRSEP
jgi:hypothetical protein